MTASGASMNRRRLLVQGGASLLAFGVLGSACGSSESGGTAGTVPVVDTSVDAVTGTIRYDTYEDWIGPQTIPDFEARYPNAEVKSNYYFFPSDRVTSFIAGNKNSDLMFMELLWLGALIEQGAIAKLDLEAIPNYDKIDSRFKVGPYSEEEALGVVLDTGRYGIAYRSDLVDQPIESWADFFEMASEYPGKFSIEDYAGLGVSAALTAQGLDLRSTDPGDIQKAEDLLIDKKGDLGPLWQNTPVTSLLKGETYAASMWDLQAPGAMGRNQDIRWVFPSDGVLSWYEGWSAIEGTAEMNAVHAFMNFGLQPRYYADFVNFTGVSNLMLAANSMVDPAARDSDVLSPSDDVIERTVPQLYLGPAQRLYDDAWSAFKSS
jgi:spermidine/putrescine transport system substrate-binding protein